MCGLAGFVDPRRVVDPDEWPSILASMRTAIRHRGPDDEGEWIDRTAGLGFTFRRLSIIDLSPLGHQPMDSADGRYAIQFNGEIYNFEALRGELESLGHRFRGRSDTEVMLAAFVQWGVTVATSRFNGMFAFALWDRTERALHLVRDRAGEKPMYYGWSNGVFLFGSELKALREHPAFDATVDRDALELLLHWGYIVQPHSIHERFRKVEPGTIVTLRGAELDVTSYWSALDLAAHGEAEPFGGTFEEAVEELESLLTDSVKLRMIADVPLGAFLSGGIDSSLVVGLMQRVASGPVRTLSIGFSEAPYDEAPYAKAVARHLGTEHAEVYVSSADALAVIPSLPAMFDEPLGDSSQIPTHLLSRLARQSVTVALTGDAGDELFGGYGRYRWGRLQRLPMMLRRAAARGMESLSTARKVRKLARVLRAADPESIYEEIVTYWHDSNLVRNRSFATGNRLRDPAHRMMLCDFTAYLPGDLLAKVDRASMAVGLETRVPLLDHRVVEFAWRLPVRWKIRGNTGKWILRRLLDRYVPRALVERPKQGFGVPIDAWLRGPLREWAEALLDETRLRREGYLDPAPIRRRWQEHLSGRASWHHDLWSVLMFQAWLETLGQPRSVPRQVVGARR